MQVDSEVARSYIFGIFRRGLCCCTFIAWLRQSNENHVFYAAEPLTF